ncbi:MAG: hypothetical protein LUD72_02600 [Bacteroidales bacterium]|nr:hypothetical protein [Bacteroidales bacterium]
MKRNKEEKEELEGGWAEFIGFLHKEFDRFSKHLKGKWFVYANLEGIFIKRIAEVWANYEGEYALEFDDGSKVGLDILQTGVLVESGSCGDCMWVFGRYKDIRFNLDTRGSYLKELQNFKRAKRRRDKIEVEKIEKQIECLRKHLIVSTNASTGED